MKKLWTTFFVVVTWLMSSLTTIQLQSYAKIALTASQVTFGFSLAGLLGIELLSINVILINVVLTLVLWYISMKEGEAHARGY